VDLEQIWSNIERRPPLGPGTVSRLIEPENDRSLFVGTAFPSRHRMLILRVNNDAVEGIDSFPSTRAVQTIVDADDKVENAVNVKIALQLEDARDVFTVFIANVAKAVLATKSDREAVQTLIERFHYWRKLLSGDAIEGLGPEEAQGLWGELWVMRHILVPNWGRYVVGSWTGPSKDDVDYRLGMSTAEVKTLRGDLPAVVQIASERQLETPAGVTLVLIALLVDRHRHGTGESLNEMIDACLALFQVPEKTHLEDLLTEWGYLEIHRQRYSETRYSIREVRAFHVEQDFPRITESILPNGVGRVKYSLSLDACQGWSVELDALDDLLPCDAPPD
jgi:hypothetical protein